MKILVNGEYLSLFRGFARDESMSEIFKLDRQIAHIKKNRKKYRQLVFILALIVPKTVLTGYALGTSQLATTAIIGTDIGMKAYEMGKYVAQAICLLGWLTEGIKCVLTGTIDGLGKVAIKWISFALMIKFLPDIVTWIFEV